VHCWPLGSRETLRAAHRLGIPTFLERPNAHTGYAYGAVLAEYRRLGLAQPPGITHEFDPDRLRLELEEYALADYLLCPSEFVASTFLANGFPDGVLVRTQYGYDPALFSPGRQPQTRNGPQLLFAGSAEPRKGLHYALDAWLSSSASRTGTLRICGSFTPGYREFLAARLAHPSIEVLPFTSDMRSVYRSSDALVLPSIEEGSALVTYEAMACGAALLVSDSAGAHADHMVEGLIHRTRDWQQLRDHMDLLGQKPQLLEELRSNAVRRSRGLTWTDAGRVLKQAYEARIRRPT
jgi:glycosyltransferase involved in cell wall biosynthesis